MSDDIVKLLGVLGSLFFCLLGFGTVIVVIVNINVDVLWLFLLALVGGLSVGAFGVVTMVKVIKY
jgi:hypothetical protein